MTHLRAGRSRAILAGVALAVLPLGALGALLGAGAAGTLDSDDLAPDLFAVTVQGQMGPAPSSQVCGEPAPMVVVVVDHQDVQMHVTRILIAPVTVRRTADGWARVADHLAVLKSERAFVERNDILIVPGAPDLPLQDLVAAFDAAGSVGFDGFGLAVNFAATHLPRRDHPDLAHRLRWLPAGRLD